MKPDPVAPSPHAEAMLKALQKAVDRSLDRKRKLGQYAVVWHEGRAVVIGGPDLNIGDQK